MKITDMTHMMNIHTPGWVGYAGNKMYYATVLEADKFLNRLGYLQGEPTLEQPSE